MKNLFNRFVREEAGQDLIEYALLAGLIALVCVATITSAGTRCRRCSAKSNRRFLSSQGWGVREHVPTASGR